MQTISNQQHKQTIQQYTNNGERLMESTFMKQEKRVDQIIIRNFVVGTLDNLPLKEKGVRHEI